METWIVMTTEDSGDREVIKGESSCSKYPFACICARDGEDCRWWEYMLPAYNSILVCSFRQFH
jgi:hypothetical protein